MQEVHVVQRNSTTKSVFSVSSVLLDIGERTVYHSTDAALNSVRNDDHDLNPVLSDEAELSIYRRMQHNDEELLCLHEGPSILQPQCIEDKLRVNYILLVNVLKNGGNHSVSTQHGLLHGSLNDAPERQR